MVNVKVVPTTDYEVLKKYLESDVVLIPESALKSFSPEVQAKVQELATCRGIVYDFGGEPDTKVDFILNQDSYAYGELLWEVNDD